MKKIIFSIFLVLAFSLACEASYIDKQLKNTKNTKKYSSINIYANKNISQIDNKTIKDPKLIKLSDCIEISDTEFDKKTKEDEKLYEIQHENLKPKKETNSIKQPLSADLYNLYRVAERIIRANNLDYINWRISLYNDTETYNAYTAMANLIAVYSGLYDTLYGNDDALAFIVSHELSHQILGHLQRTADLDNTLRKWVPQGEMGTLDLIYYKKRREIELEADSQAFELLSRAGYSPKKAMDAISFMEAMPNSNAVLLSTHPHPKERKENALEIARYISPDWIKEGRYNLYNSQILEAKKSSDKVSFVITGNNQINPYQPENYEKRLLRYAYMSYLNADNERAVKFFEKLVKENPKYEYYLYLSYANENLYKETKKDKYIKKAIETADIAKGLSNNKYTSEQVNTLKSL